MNRYLEIYREKIVAGLGLVVLVLIVVQGLTVSPDIEGGKLSPEVPGDVSVAEMIVDSGVVEQTKEFALPHELTTVANDAFYPGKTGDGAPTGKPEAPLPDIVTRFDMTLPSVFVETRIAPEIKYPPIPELTNPNEMRIKAHSLDKLVMNDGRVLEGWIVDQFSDVVRFRHKGITQEIKKAEIAQIVPHKSEKDAIKNAQRELRSSREAEAHYNFALELLRVAFQTEEDTKNLLAAVEHLNNAVKYNPKYQPAYEVLFTLYGDRLFSFNDVLGLIDRAIGNELEVPDFRLAKAVYLYRLGLYTQARTAFGDAAKIEGDEKKYRLYEALCLIFEGESADLAKAETMLADLMKARGNDPQVLRAMCMLYWRRQDIARTRAALMNLRGVDDKAADMWNNLGVIYTHDNMPERAVDAFERAVQADPGMLEANRNLANAYLNSGDQKIHARFAAHLKVLIDLDFLSAAPQLFEALEAMNTGQLEQAGAALDEAERREPNNPLVSYLRGYQSYLAKEYHGAEKYFTASRNDGLAIERFFEAMAYLNLRQGERAEALRYLVRVNELSKNRPKILTILGHLALDESQRHDGREKDELFKRAGGFYQQALNNDPGYVEAIKGKVYLAMQSDAPLSAMTIIRQGLQIKPGEPFFLTCSQRLDEWQMQATWVDMFNRADGSEIGNGWIRTTGSGPIVKIADGALVFTGTQLAGSGGGATYVERTFREGDLMAIDMNVELAQFQASTRIGMTVFQGREMATIFFQSPDVNFSTSKGQGAHDQSIGQRQFSIGLRLDNGRIIFRVNRIATGDPIATEISGKGEYRVRIWAIDADNATFEFKVDSIELLYKKTQN